MHRSEEQRGSGDRNADDTVVDISTTDYETIRGIEKREKAETI